MRVHSLMKVRKPKKVQKKSAQMKIRVLRKKYPIQNEKQDSSTETSEIIEVGGNQEEKTDAGRRTYLFGSGYPQKTEVVS